jgi:hypothetical protein
MARREPIRGQASAAQHGPWKRKNATASGMDGRQPPFLAKVGQK